MFYLIKALRSWDRHVSIIKALRCFGLLYEKMVQVRVSEGVLEGELVHNEYGSSFFSYFKGIPYAQPPVGELRFKVNVMFIQTIDRLVVEIRP